MPLCKGFVTRIVKSTCGLMQYVSTRKIWMRRTRRSHLYQKYSSMPQTFCIWLGPGSEDSDPAMDFIVRLAKLEDFDRIMEDLCTTGSHIPSGSLMMRGWFCSRWSFEVLALVRRAIATQSHRYARETFSHCCTAAKALIHSSWAYNVSRSPLRPFRLKWLIRNLYQNRTDHKTTQRIEYSPS